MGVAEECDEEGGRMDEHIQRLTDTEKEVEKLRAALVESERMRSSAAGSGDLCQMEKCSRHVDWWCDLCKTSICQKCSKTKCAAADKHNLSDFDEIYKGVKVKFIRWRDDVEETFLVLDHRQKKLMKIIRDKKREVSEAHDESLGDQGDRMIEVGELMKKLEPLSKQVEDLKCNLAAYGDRVDKLNRPDFFSVINDLMERLNLSSGSSNGSPTSSTCSSPVESSGLQFISDHGTDDEQCVTVHHTQSGDILLGCLSGVKILNRDSREVKHVTDYPSAMVVENEGEVFISSWDEDEETVTVYKYNMDTKANVLLFSYPMKSSHAAFISVSDVYIACIDHDNKNIKLYERRSGTLTTKQLSGFTVICNLLLSDGCLLATGHDDDEKCMLKKYRLSEKGEPTLVWSCDDVPRTYGGIAVAGDGQIYVNGGDNKTIYLITGEGQKVMEMTHDKLPDLYVDISIRDDELAVAGWTDNNILLFRIV